MGHIGNQDVDEEENGGPWARISEKNSQYDEVDGDEPPSPNFSIFQKSLFRGSTHAKFS